MLASIEKVEGGYIASFNRPLKHSVQKAWTALTQNDKLRIWMPNLEVKDLRDGGLITFNLNDGTSSTFDIKITDYVEHSVLQYEWGTGWVRFELSPTPDGCLLVLEEFIPAISDHTSKDLAGWHVCLDVLNDLLDGHLHSQFPQESWEKSHLEYTALVTSIRPAP